MQVEKKSEIKSSLKGWLWEEKQYDEKIKEQLKKDLGLSDFQAQILTSRHDVISNFTHFLKPTLKDMMPDPFSLLDMDKAAKFIAAAIIEKKKIAIFGDYDVDGATSAAILKKFFKHYDIDARIYIPDRIIEGYGPNIKALKQLKDEGHDLVITVDCGTSAIAPLEEAASFGLDVIVVDHHISNDLKPQAIAIVNPNRDDDNSNLGYLAGVGVCFMLMVAVNKILRDEKYSEKTSKDLLNLLSLLDLVALGTVCDCVPLVELNRAFVNQGLKILNRQQNLGIKHLLEVSSIAEKTIEPFHLGFMLGPRINAAGRVGKSSLGSELLASEVSDDLENISLQLDVHNKERQAIEASVLIEAEEQVINKNLGDDPVIIIAGEYWHPGVIGIVSSRIKDKFQKPTMVIALDGENGKASCRSMADINIGEIIIAAKHAGIISEGGGHKMAAGFSITQNNVDALRDFIRQNYQDDISQKLAKQRLWFDYCCSLENINADFFQEIQALQPYGMGNEEPIFVFHNLRVVKVFQLGKDHLKLIVAEYAGGRFGKSYEAIAWKSLNTDYGEYLLNSVGSTISLAGTVKENIWQERVSYQITITDAIIK